MTRLQKMEIKAEEPIRQAKQTNLAQHSYIGQCSHFYSTYVFPQFLNSSCTNTGGTNHIRLLKVIKIKYSVPQPHQPYVDQWLPNCTVQKQHFHHCRKSLLGSAKLKAFKPRQCRTKTYMLHTRFKCWSSFLSSLSIIVHISYFYRAC